MARLAHGVARGGAWRPISWSALLVALVLGTALPAAAGFTPGGDDDTVTVGGSETTTDQTGGGGGGGDVAIRIPKAYKEYRYIPACSANDIDGGADALCGAAVNTCPDDRDIRYRVYTLQHEADGSVKDGADWEPAGTQCRGPDDPTEGGPIVITTADIADEARKAAPATVVHVEPVTKTYVNLPTNFYADTAAQDATVEVLGQTIGLQFRPSGFTWAFGDGTSGTGGGVQNAAVGAKGAVEHLYRRSGTVSVTLTRTFEVGYTLPGGVTGTLPAPGVSNTSAPLALQVGEIQALVTGGR